MTLTKTDLGQIQELIASVLEPFAAAMTETMASNIAELRYEMHHELHSFRQEFRAHVERNQREHEEFRADLKQPFRAHNEYILALFGDHQKLEKRVRKLEKRA